MIGKRLQGWLALAMMVVTWVAQSEIVQSIEQRMNRPFLITFINHGSMSLILVGLPRDVWSRLSAAVRMPLARIVQIAAMLSLMYTAGDYLWYLALPYTSVAEATVLFNVQSVFAVALSAALLGERPGAARVGGIAVSLVGVGLVSFDGSSGGAGGRRLLGDMLVVGGAAAYAAYEVLYRWLLVGDLASGAEVNAATALVGVTSLLTTWPLFPALDLAGVETFAEPVPADLWPWIALNAALALVFNVAIMVSVAYLSPVTAACATMLTIPLSAVVDYFFKHASLSPVACGGAALVVFGFALTELHPPKVKRDAADYDAIAPDDAEAARVQ